MTTESARPVATWRYILTTGGIVLAILGVFGVLIGLSLGRSVAEKVATECLMPPGLIGVMFVVLSAHLLRSRQIRTFVFTALVAFFYFAATNRILADWIVNRIESPYQQIDPLANSFDVVVLLGGATSETPLGHPQVNGNGDRLVTAARMYHAGRVKTICCTGRSIDGLAMTQKSESLHAEELLIQLGVSPASIVRLGGRNTSEEMREIASEFGGNRIGILTSAWHLPRAMRLANASGVQASPIPSNFLGHPTIGRPAGAFVRDCVPSFQALLIHSKVAKELLAKMVGR